MKSKPSPIRFPGPTNRTTLIGRTGSGKSQFGAYVLSRQNFHVMPWVIIDFKDQHTDIINKIERVTEIDYSVIPEHPGLYILKPRTEDGRNGILSDWLDRVLQHGNIGLFFDEVFPVGQHNDGFNTIMMQGRSKYVPIICCTQRPSNVSTYCFSEASYYFIFDLTKISDRKKVSEEIPQISSRYELPEYHSYYYDVVKKYLGKLGPAPDEKSILQKIAAKIPEPPRRTL